MKTILLCVYFVALNANEITLKVVKIHRNLAQEYNDEVSDDNFGKEEEATVKQDENPVVHKGLATPGVAELGPKLFYDGTDFLMKLGAPIIVTIYSGESDEKLSIVELDGKAVSVKGGMIYQDIYKVGLGWQSQNFGNIYKVALDWQSQNFGKDYEISTIQIHMYFARTKDEFVMEKLEVVGFTINAKQTHLNSLDVKSKHGYKVAAPLGSSFHCYNPGLFAPRPSLISNEFKVGLTFPDMQLQVFRFAERNQQARFGPDWACKPLAADPPIPLIPIGLLDCLLLSLLLAVICFYWFNKNTASIGLTKTRLKFLWKPNISET